MKIKMMAPPQESPVMSLLHWVHWSHHVRSPSRLHFGSEVHVAAQLFDQPLCSSRLHADFPHPWSRWLIPYKIIEQPCDTIDHVYTMSINGGFTSHGGTPSHHPSDWSWSTAFFNGLRWVKDGWRYSYFRKTIGNLHIYHDLPALNKR